MLTIAGRKYAKDAEEMTDSLFQQDGTCNGYYRIKRNGILLLTLQQKPFAFIANMRGSQWFVTADRLANGRTVYMQGLGDYTACELGISDFVYSAQCDAAKSAIQQTQEVTGRTASEYGNDEIRWPDGLQHY